MQRYGKIELATGHVIEAPVLFPVPAWERAVIDGNLPANALGDPGARVPGCPAELVGYGWFAYSQVKVPPGRGQTHGEPVDAVDMEAETVARTWPVVWQPRPQLDALLTEQIRAAATEKILAGMNLHQQLNATARGVELLRAMVLDEATVEMIAEADLLVATWGDVKAIRAAATDAIAAVSSAGDETAAEAITAAFEAKPASTIIAEAAA